MALTIPERIANAQAGKNPTIICKVPSGWVAMCDMQYLRGYVIHLADPAVASLNDLDAAGRQVYLLEMVLIGDALVEVTGAYRINYAIAGNRDPYLHAHIVPRYMDEPEQYRTGLPWSYPREVMDGRPFEAGRDRQLMEAIGAAIRKRL
jgi:diadenosine tetraphosphate (Ap4A) HIT family hydrolase